MKNPVRCKTEQGTFGRPAQSSARRRFPGTMSHSTNVGRVAGAEASVDAREMVVTARTACRQNSAYRHPLHCESLIRRCLHGLTEEPSLRKFKAAPLYLRRYLVVQGVSKRPPICTECVSLTAQLRNPRPVVTGQEHEPPKTCPLVSKSP